MMAMDASYNTFSQYLQELLPNVFVGLQCRFKTTTYTVISVEDEFATLKHENGKTERTKTQKLFAGFCDFLIRGPTRDHHLPRDYALWLFIRACAGLSIECKAMQAKAKKHRKDLALCLDMEKNVDEVLALEKKIREIKSNPAYMSVTNIANLANMFTSCGYKIKNMRVRRISLRDRWSPTGGNIVKSHKEATEAQQLGAVTGNLIHGVHPILPNKLTPNKRRARKRKFISKRSANMDIEGNESTNEQSRIDALSDGTVNTSHSATQSSSSAVSSLVYIPTAQNLVPRYNGPSEDVVTNEQRAIRDAIIASRPRTGISGPFGPWLAIPQIAQPAQALGHACRYGTSLTFAESELVILLTAAKTRSHAEFDIHAGEALAAGWSLGVMHAIPRDDHFCLTAVEGRLVPLLENVRLKAIVKFTAELLVSCSVSDETYATTKAAVDGKDSVLVEITSIVGYYTYVAYTLNVFRIPSK